jgi:positive regulator of sigma E activity
MTQTARVVECDGQNVRICYDRPGSEKSRASRSFWGIKNRRFTASNPDGLALSPGDEVTIYMPSGRTVGSAFMVFVFPLLLGLAAIIVSRPVFPGWDDGYRALAALGAIFAGLGINALIQTLKKRLGKETVPVITALADPQSPERLREKKDCGSCGLCS